MLKFATLEELEFYIEEAINIAMESNVSQEVAKLLKDNTKKVVYDAYEPSYYVRRGENGGLLDENNIQKTIDKTSHTLTMENIAKPKKLNAFDNPSTSLAYLIEYGRVPNIFNDQIYPWMFPRPFIRKTISDLQNGNVITKAMTNGLRANGIKATKA